MPQGARRRGRGVLALRKLPHQPLSARARRHATRVDVRSWFLCGVCYPPKRRLPPIRRGCRPHTGPAGVPSHSPPPPLGGNPKCMGRGEPCRGPRGAGKRRAPTPRDRSVPSRGVSGHPGAARSLPLLPFSRWVGFYVEGGTRHPPPGPTTPTGKPSRGISMGKSTPRDVEWSLGVREPAQATPRTPQGDVWLASCTPPIMPTLMGPLCVRHPGARQTRPTGL